MISYPDIVACGRQRSGWTVGGCAFSPPNPVVPVRSTYFPIGDPHSRALAISLRRWTPLGFSVLTLAPTACGR